MTAAGGSGAFSSLTSGTNTTAAMIIGSGASLNVSGTGSISCATQTATDNSTLCATDQYVTTAIANAVAGVNPAVAVNAATTQASDTSGLTYNNGVSGIGATLTGSVNTAITIDGVTLTLGQRLLVKNDTQSPSGAFNGVYSLTQVQTGILAPILTRSLDFDTPSDMNNTGAIPVISGTVNGTTQWLMTATVVTVGTTPLTFAQFSSNPTNLVTAVSPGVGLCHFAGSTQACTSSAVVNADITNSTIDLTTKVTGVLPVANGGSGSSSAATFYTFFSVNGASAGTVTLNTTNLWSYDLPVTVTGVTKIGIIVNTADNSANTYDIGLYNSAGTLGCHMGSAAGSTFAATTGFKVISCTGGASNMPAGRYYLGMTSGTAATMTLGGPTLTGTTYCHAVPATNNTTSGGVLNSSVTFNADALVTCTVPALSISQL